MLLADAEKLALELMAQFGLLPQWTFEFDDAVRRFGCCQRRGLFLSQGEIFLGNKSVGNELCYGGKITLSRELTLRNDRDKIEDTIRHEIAHALCPPKSGHGPAWKESCKRTGAKPERCYNEEVDAPKGDWQATCRGCGRIHHKFRKPRFNGDRYCAYKECRRANPPEYGQRFNPICKLVFRHKDALPDPSEAQRRKAIEAMKQRFRAQEASK